MLPFVWLLFSQRSQTKGCDKREQCHGKNKRRIPESVRKIKQIGREWRERSPKCVINFCAVGNHESIKGKRFHTRPCDFFLHSPRRKIRQFDVCHATDLQSRDGRKSRVKRHEILKSKVRSLCRIKEKQSTVTAPNVQAQRTQQLGINGIRTVKKHACIVIVLKLYLVFKIYFDRDFL